MIHVMSNATGTWTVRADGACAPISQHGTETDAERAAVAHATGHADVCVLVHDRYARVREARAALSGAQRAPSRCSQDPR